MNTRFLLIGALVLVGAQSAAAQPRAFRLFLSTIGLSDPSSPQSPAADPTSDLEINPHLTALPNQPRRLYVWGQICPPGTPNNAEFNRMSFRANVTGTGGTLSGFNFWNYSNGGYQRWQQFAQSGDATSASFAAASVVGGGVSNTPAAAAADTHYRRFATNGTTRIDCTLLGWIEGQGSQIGTTLDFRLAIGASGIGQSGQPLGPRYLGWGDEGVPGNPIADAQLLIVPEPAGLLSLVLACALVRRRHAVV